VVVDKLSKYAHFIPLRHPYTAAKVAEVFVDNIYKLHGMPLTLVSNRDPVFTSNFWQALFKATGTQLNMSSANHPETDGQTKRVNSLCEFWYNNSWQSSLGKTSFQVIYGREPRYFGLTATDTVAPGDIQDWLRERALVLDCQTTSAENATAYEKPG
jgi:hypothetical protein